MSQSPTHTFAGNVGVNGGNGYELKIDTAIASGIVFSHNQMFGTPDAIIKSTNLASVSYQDNLYPAWERSATDLWCYGSNDTGR